MSITILLYKDTPIEDVTADQINEYLSLVTFCHDKHLTGNMKHTTFQVEGIEPFGYILDLDDEVNHTDDLWVVYLDAKDAANHKFHVLANNVGTMIGTDMRDAYMVDGHVVVQYIGGAKFIRDLHARHRRADLTAV
jgi:hypothetical protein